MRKIFGGFLGLLAALFLGLAYAQMARAEDPDCTSALAKKIADLEAQDKSGILELQRRITRLKLALETVTAGKKTAEGYIKSQQDLLMKINEQDGSKILERLIALYQDSGASAEDRAKAIARLGDTMEKAKTASYWKPVTRFKNLELSAFVLAHQLVQKDKSPYGEADAAILWLDSEISDGVEKATHRGSASANLSEASSWVVRFTGVIDHAYSADQLKTALKQLQDDLDTAMNDMVNRYREELAKSCVELKNCTDCKVTDEHKNGVMEKAIALVRRQYAADPKYKDKRVQARIVGEAQEKKVDVKVDLQEEPSSKDSPPPSPDPSSSVSPVPDQDKKVFAASDRLEQVPAGKEVQAPQEHYNACEVSLTFKRVKVVGTAKIGEHYDIYVNYVVKNPKTNVTALPAAYHFHELPNQTVKDVWMPKTVENDKLKKTCPSSPDDHPAVPSKTGSPQPEESEAEKQKRYAGFVRALVAGLIGSPDGKTLNECNLEWSYAMRAQSSGGQISVTTVTATNSRTKAKSTAEFYFSVDAFDPNKTKATPEQEKKTEEQFKALKLACPAKT